MRPRIFVTGGRGMVGRTLLEQLDPAEWTIAAPSRAELDLTDARATAVFIADFRPDAIVHAAGRVGGIQANISEPVDFLVMNTDIGRNVILGANAAGVRKFINLASSCVYPNDRDVALREEDILSGPLEPTNEGYAIAKIFALRLCQYLNRQSGSAYFKTLIPCNLYGPNDHFNPEVSHLVPAAIQKIATAKRLGSESVEIWGDGTARREFLYTGDLANAILRAIRDFERLPELMNVGLGYDFSVLEYYKAAAAAVDWRGYFTYDETKPVGMRRKLVDVTRQAEWGWRPLTTLYDGLAMTYRGFQEINR
ncbi:GDP-L-fucose synthase family protein [Methylobacterium iners]|uniref:GDP-L-fucose synthase n=1 Tax=Methylobacterium iners TaxID=418707 RepID=A0ABQ4S2M2_9HYPH|nr:GDP-L-fucose synthase [Methylobacterium iners]GJD96652.1 GDP-L-colitose synthase [Methylobacterium iners]